MPFLRQTNFLGGELDPLLWGRTELELFQKGLRRMRNFFPSKQGAAVSRPGTKYIADAKLQGDPVRLIPFFYTDAQSYYIEAGEKYFRIRCQGTVVADLVTDWTAAELVDLQFAQVGDVMTLCHPAHWPRELKRTNHTTWSISVLNFDVPEGLGSPQNEVVGYGAMPTADDANGLPARLWEWRVSMVFQTESGLKYETKASPVAYLLPAGGGGLTSMPSSVAVYPSKPVTFRWRFPGALFSEYFVCFRFYRGRSGLFGWVGDTLTPTTDFVDAAADPDYTRPPLKGENPFAIFDSTGATLRVESPCAVTFYQERRGFGGTTQRPGQVFLSETGNYKNFDTRLFQASGESLLYEIASRRRERIRSMLGLDRLLLFTEASLWSMSGQDGSPLDFDSVDARMVEEVGSNGLAPIVIDGCALWARAKGVGARAAVPANTRSGYDCLDLTMFVKHLFTGSGKQLVDWCYQEDPWGLVWGVRSDGSMVSLTFELESKTWAWARHDTQGTVLSVCAVPEGSEDAVYMLVSRPRLGPGGWADVICLERMTSRWDHGGIDDDICLDSATRWSGTGNVVNGLEHLEGNEVYVTGLDNPVRGPFTVDNGAVVLDEAATPNSGGNAVLYVGLKYTPELETLDVAATDVRMRQKQVVRVGLEVDQSRGLKVGPDFDTLTEWRERSVSAGYNVPSLATQLVTVDAGGGWNQHARIALRQDAPLPVTVVGLVREIAMGD